MLDRGSEFLRKGGAGRLITLVAVALAAAGVAAAVGHAPGGERVVELLNGVFYEGFYRLRPPEDRTGGPVVVVAVDQGSLERMAAEVKYGWPWPRQAWGAVVQYLDEAGAAAVAFDLVFTERSSFGADTGDEDDDSLFAEAIGEARVPVVMARLVDFEGKWGAFALPQKSPDGKAWASRARFGAVQVGGGGDGGIEREGGAWRVYRPPAGRPTLAAAAVEAAGLTARFDPTSPFLLHYFGPHQRRLPDGKLVRTFRYVPAFDVVAAALGYGGEEAGLDPGLFQGKIVLIASTAVGTFDVKRTPVDVQAPGVEIHATAIDDLVSGRRVLHVGPVWTAAAAAVFAALTAAGTMLPRGAAAKVLAGLLGPLALILLAAAMFAGETIRWLPPAVPVLAAAVAGLGGVGVSYAAEDRRAKRLLKTLDRCISPAVAAELEQDPTKLAVGGQTREMTVMFTDLAGFTDLTERLGEKIEPLLNFYLGEMSEVVLDADGTIDKYIGDAIMSFWNAPLPNAEHPTAACRTALALARRENELRPRLREMGAEHILTRIGIHTGPMVVGFMGSPRHLSYTVIGDAVNLAARLEPANKLYDTQILVSGRTVEAVCGRAATEVLPTAGPFLFRQVDVLRVKGKTEPMAVYELMAERSSAERATLERAERYAEAYDLYRRGNWSRAAAACVDLCGDFGEDGPSRTLCRRATAFEAQPPPDDWDGVYVATSK